MGFNSGFKGLMENLKNWKKVRGILLAARKHYNVRKNDDLLTLRDTPQFYTGRAVPFDCTAKEEQDDITLQYDCCSSTYEISHQQIGFIEPNCKAVSILTLLICQ